MLADGLEHVLYRDLLAAEISGKDRAAINEDRRHVEPDHRHRHARQRLVAAGETDQCVVSMAPYGQFDGIGDAFARWQRRAHAVMAHGDAVGHGDSAEFARGAAGGGDALLDRLRLTHPPGVTRRLSVPEPTPPPAR